MADNTLLPVNEQADPRSLAIVPTGAAEQPNGDWSRLPALGATGRARRTAGAGIDGLSARLSAALAPLAGHRTGLGDGSRRGGLARRGRKVHRLRLAGGGDAGKGRVDGSVDPNGPRTFRDFQEPAAKPAAATLRVVGGVAQARGGQDPRRAGRTAARRGSRGLAAKAIVGRLSRQGGDHGSEHYSLRPP